MGSQKGKESPCPPARSASAPACDEFLPAEVKHVIFGPGDQEAVSSSPSLTHLLAGYRGPPGPTGWVSHEMKGV